MKKLLPILLLAGFSSPAMADLTHKLSSSVQLSVNAAATQVDRIGSTYTISGSNIDTTDGTTAGTVSAGTITSGVYAILVQSQQLKKTAGSAFSFTASHTFKVMQYQQSAPTTGASR